MKKRNRGIPVAGHPGIKQRVDGKFSVDVYLKNPRTGKRDRRMAKVCGSLHEAIAWKEDTLAKHRLRLLPPRESEKVTVGYMVKLKLSSISENASYADSERIFRAIEKDFGVDRTLESIDEIVLKQWVDTLRRRPSKNPPYQPLSNKTIFNTLQHLLGLFRMAKRKGFIKIIPEYKFKKRFGKRKITISLESFLRALDHMPNAPEPMKAMSMMALFTGQRLNDLRQMTWDQVQEARISYQSSKTQVEDLMIRRAPRELLEELALLKEQAKTEFIFANPKTGNPYSPNAIRRRITWACEAAGVPRFTPHQIRHQATTTGLELTGDPDLVEKWIGWLNPGMIRSVYGHLGNRADRLMEQMETKIQEIRDQVNPGAAMPENVVPFSVMKNRTKRVSQNR